MQDTPPTLPAEVNWMVEYLQFGFALTLMIVCVGLIFWLVPQLASVVKRIKQAQSTQERAEQMLERQYALVARVEKLVDRLENKLGE